MDFGWIVQKIEGSILHTVFNLISALCINIPRLYALFEHRIEPDQLASNEALIGSNTVFNLYV